METESILIWGFIILLIIVLITVIALFIHAGLFSPVDISTCKPDVGELLLAYKFARGPYKESGALFTEVHTLLPQYRTIGVYYDDPKKKEPTRLRYIVGLILSEGGKKIDPEEETLLKDRGYNFATLPGVNHAVQTTFPFNSTLSIIVAIMKVYPALSEYVETRSLCAHPFIEIYDNEKKVILFFAPLEKQDDFYVPEVNEEEELRQTEDEDGGNASVSWEDSASIIRNDEVTDVDSSESIAEQVPLLKQEPLQASEDPTPIPPVAQEQRQVPNGEDSDANTGSSFEEIDEKDSSITPAAESLKEEKNEE